MSRIPAQYADADLTEYEDAVPELAAIAQNKGAGLDNSIVLITGPHGTGKTRALYALKKRCKSMGTNFSMRVVPNLVLKLQALARDDMTELEKVLGDLQNKQGVLALDDLGAEKTTDFVRQALYIVIAARERWGRPTIITSNLTPAQIGEHLGDRIASRVCAGTHVHFEERRR